MSKLALIVKNEYLTNIRTRSFWVSTLIIPVVIFAFLAFGSMVAAGSLSGDSLQHAVLQSLYPGSNAAADVSGLLAGLFLTLFLMMYGTMIFNKVKAEKNNRIIEILATCVDGRTMILAKILAVALIGLTQLIVWSLLVIAGTAFLSGLTSWPYVSADLNCIPSVLGWTAAFFIGGYVFYGSLYAGAGAVTDKNNENQMYITLLTFMLLASFYVGQYALAYGDSPFSVICGYFPFTAPTAGCVNAVTGNAPLWQSLLSLGVLYGVALVALLLAGKLYDCSLLFRGKTLSPVDLLKFMRSR